MSYMERADIPYYWALAENFTICDNYHCSVLGPTYPNRLFSMSATNDPEGKGGGPLIETTDDFEFVKGRFTWTTMPEQLTAKGVTWKHYTGSLLGLRGQPLYFFKQYQKNAELKAKGLEPQLPDGLHQGPAPQRTPAGVVDRDVAARRRAPRDLRTGDRRGRGGDSSSNTCTPTKCGTRPCC